MPAGKGSNADSGGNKTAARETFRPPWVKEGTEGLPPKPSNLTTKTKPIKEVAPVETPQDTRPSWVKNRRTSNDDGDSDTPIAGLRKVTIKTNQNQENGNSKDNTFVRPQLKKVTTKEPAKLQSNEVKIPIKLNSVVDRPPLKKVTTINNEDKEIDKATPRERNAIVRQESLKKIPPKAPPLPPPAPALPRQTDLKPLSDKQKAVIDLLKARPKVRPDWTAMLKEVESGKKLKHVQCNDRSQPLLTKTKDESQFIYESEKSEKDTSHNQLIKEIQQGVALRKTKTNDRSKPILEGLRKFRRQMTIEEQIIKSQSMASIPPEEIANEADELDDIDKVRDDLQSTKQMLALELRNKEALGRDNKRFQARIAQLEAELEKEKQNKQIEAPSSTDANDKLITSLKSETAESRKVAQELEKKYNDIADQLDHAKSELENFRREKQLLEKKLQETSPTAKRSMSIADRKESIAKQSESEDEEFELTESESEGSDNDEKRERKAQRELKQFRNKLRNYKNKEDNAKQERMALKRQVKQLQLAMKAEKKKYKALQKEVKKMAAMMKEVGGETDDELDNEPEKDENSEPEEEDEESESDTDSSETESDSEDSDSEPEDATVKKKKDNLTERVKKHEGRLNALKKGNYMLKTNVERLQDDLNKLKEDSVTLKQDLDSVLAELD